MSPRLKRGLSVILGLVLIVVSCSLWYQGAKDVPLVEYSAPGPTAPTQTLQPIPSASESSSSPTPTSTTGVTDPAAGDMPVQVTVKRGSKDIVRTMNIGQVTSFSAQDVWSPVPDTAEWYRIDDYPRPGALSTLKSVIGGHVTYGRKLNGDPKPNVFFTLENAKKGDVVIVRYKSGKTYKFTVTKIVVENKDVIRGNQEIWGYSDLSRSVVLFTCDTDGGYSSDGHTLNNRAVIATMK